MTGSGQGRTEMVDIGKVGSAGIAGSSGEVVGPGEEVNRVSCTFVPFDVPVKSYGGPMDEALADAVAAVQGWRAEARRSEGRRVGKAGGCPGRSRRSTYKSN